LVQGTPGNYLPTDGGVILPGVALMEQQTVRANANIYANAWGYARAPNKLHVYDAGYIKLKRV
jgi:hypothetical protein